MKTTKVTYQTSSGQIFKTIVPTRDKVEEYMAAAYSPQITIIKMRPSIKQKYSRFVNIIAK